MSVSSTEKLTNELTPTDGRSAAQMPDHLARFGFSPSAGHVVEIEGTPVVSQAGLMWLANERNCDSMHVELVLPASDPANHRWIVKAIVYRAAACRGFEAYGEASPANVSPQFHGAELQIAENRALARAIRRAYGVVTGPADENNRQFHRRDERRTAGSTKKMSLRTRLNKLIKVHQLDPESVRLYAADYCNVQELRNAKPEQVAIFVNRLEQWANSDRNALLCHLASYPRKSPQPAPQLELREVKTASNT
jgi:hypothetical protein